MRSFDQSQGIGHAANSRGGFTLEDREKAARIAWENRPSVVLGEMAVVLGITAAIVATIDIILAMLGIR